jgi:hypothetical protein
MRVREWANVSKVCFDIGQRLFGFDVRFTAAE